MNNKSPDSSEEINSRSEHARLIIRQYLSSEKLNVSRFKKQQAIYHQGDYPNGLYIILSGKVKVSKRGIDKKEQILTIAKENEFLGCECLMNYSKYYSTAIALTEVYAAVLPVKAFHLLAKSNTELLNAFAELMCSNMLEREKQLTDLAYKPVRGRLADALLTLEKIFHKAKKGEIVLSRNELASYIGSVRETTSRFLSEFKSDHIIQVTGDSITIADKEKLTSLSDKYK